MLRSLILMVLMEALKTKTKQRVVETVEEKEQLFWQQPDWLVVEMELDRRLLT